ncbi:SDR family NAD(P)-dependent oxidoreductase [Sphingomonas sp. SFZ2018-12]|uniref:SDR family NAD(P)-dependent oxidoreductase n=1 Tax=Sphingomonas sp. SFZ2018-12 TaxID=2683197 RepID=UPI001F0F432F|nr:SDR family oxidoreductase [Sphingomonas sp. SFZ2018-12]MBM3928543.1 SDR family oxidoreductase [Sphingomonadales bacterium]MCH4894396.1 SDR family NAD(P)-dependent oxidoreductase [Sphingomonas sp. SFZ2018-12]
MSGSDGHGLAGRVAIVTGGGRGLGRAMTLGLAQAGVRVVATAARELAEVEAVAREAERACGDDRVRPLLADVTRAEDCAAVVRAALVRFGRLDILVNNAGRGMKYVSDTFLTEPTRFWEVAPDTWRMVTDTNVNGPFLMARAAVPAMLEAGWGRIVNISMNRETMRRRGFSPYGPSKAALESETAIWAQDLADSGITVNALLPGGATLTGMIPEGLPDSARDGLLSPEIVVPPLLWLCSDAAAAVTGKRLDARKWMGVQPGSQPAQDALEDVGW